ncbi:RNA-binding protein Nova-1 [Schistosoma japonicum]|nr:RNA-binding protein Nova-1 [Schistosoma japonicum]
MLSQYRSASMHKLAAGRELDEPVDQCMYCFFVSRTGSVVNETSTQKHKAHSDYANLYQSSADQHVNLYTAVLFASSNQYEIFFRMQTTYVKILVPNCTAGLVIGKLGSYVREIKDRTGAFIQISQKSVEINLLERCITIAGEPEQCRAAVDLVLAKIAEDPQSAIYPAISYSHARGPVASAYPTGSPFAIMPTVRFEPSQRSHLHLPPARDASCSNIEGWDDNAPSGVGFSAISNPFGSSFFQAALLQVQAAALAANLNTTNYYPTFTPVDIPPADMSTLFTHGLSTNIGYVPPEDANFLPAAFPEYGQGFCSGTPTPNVTLLGSGGASGGGSSTSGGSGGHGSTLLHETIWPIVDSQIRTPTCFDAAYQAPLNFAIYPTNQSVLTAMTSRHPSESYPSHPDIFSPSSPYLTAISQPSFTISFSTSPSLVSGNVGNPIVPQIDPANPHLATLYSGITPSLCLSQTFPISGGSEMDIKVPPIGQQPPTLNDLLGSLQLSCNTEDVVSEMNQTLTHHGFLNLAGSGPLPLISPPGSQPARYISPVFATHLPSPTSEARSSAAFTEVTSASWFIGVRPSTLPDTSFVKTSNYTLSSYSDSSSNVYSRNQSLEVSSKHNQSYLESFSEHEHHSTQSSCAESSVCISTKQENELHTFPLKSHNTQFCELSILSASADRDNDYLPSSTPTDASKEYSVCGPNDILCCSCADNSSSIHTPASNPCFGSCACSRKLNSSDHMTHYQQSKPSVTEVPATKNIVQQGNKVSSNNEQGTSYQVRTDN